MAGRAGRTYKRDANGRFASTGGGGSKRPAAKRVAKGPNRLTRDNSGKITSVGGDGATVRGGRLRTAGGKQRGTQVARLKSAKLAQTIKTKSLSPEANYRIIRTQRQRFGTVGTAAKAMRKRGALKKSGDIEQLAAIARRTKLNDRSQGKTNKQLKRRDAPKRLSYRIQYHGTNQQAASSIRQDGFKESKSGVYGAGVYSSSNKKTARAYSPKKGGAILRLRVPADQFEKATVIKGGSAPMEVRARNRALGISRIEEHLDYSPHERWLVSPAQDASKWLDRRQVIPKRKGRKKVYR